MQLGHIDIANIHSDSQSVGSDEPAGKDEVVAATQPAAEAA
jgi:hypothetical protein